MDVVNWNQGPKANAVPFVRLVGLTSAVLVVAVISFALGDALGYAVELARGNPVHVLSAVGLLGAVALPATLGVSFATGRGGRLVGAAAMVTGLAFVVLGVDVLDSMLRAARICDGTGRVSVYCNAPPWWLGTMPAALAYLIGGVGLTVAGSGLVYAARQTK